MSPNTNSLAYKDLNGEPAVLSVEEFAPELSLIISKRRQNLRDVTADDRAISIAGNITVSF